MARNDSMPAGDVPHPQGMEVLLAKFLEWMALKNYSPRTIANRRIFLGVFIGWAEERGLMRPGDITKPILESYQRHLYYRRKRNGEPLSFRSQHTHLVPVRVWFKWLARNNHILYNPASELELPKVERRLPRHVLSVREVDQIINLADVRQPLGIRDRAILETLYSTGIRRMELIAVTLYDIDAERGTLTVRQGKGRKDRVVPIGDRALGWIDRYLHQVRPSLLVGGGAGDKLFLTHLGLPFTLARLSELVRDYVAAAGLGKKGSCHLFRHTMATLMLENGADIRFIQAMLGHASLATTEIYTQVSIKKLKEIHTATHPARAERDVETRGETKIEQNQPGT